VAPMAHDAEPPLGSDLSRDPIVNVIHNGIKRGIRVALDNECWMAVVTLTLSSMYTMAYLGMPAGRHDVSRRRVPTRVVLGLPAGRECDGHEDLADVGVGG